jgi:hypothetical protein
VYIVLYDGFFATRSISFVRINETSMSEFSFVSRSCATKLAAPRCTNLSRSLLLSAPPPMDKGFTRCVSAALVLSDSNMFAGTGAFCTHPASIIPFQNVFYGCS